MPDFLLPDLGEGLDEAEVIAWRVKPGDRVAVDEVVAEVETAKAVVELPVPYAGVVATLHAKPGSTVSVGQPLITIATETPAGSSEPGVVVPDAQVSGGEGGASEASGSVLIGYGTAPARRPGPGAADPVPEPVPQPVPRPAPPRRAPPAGSR